MVLPYIAGADVGIRPYETVADSAFFNGIATGGKKRQVDRQERLQGVRRLDGLRGIGRLLQVIAAPLEARQKISAMLLTNVNRYATVWLQM